MTRFLTLTATFALAGTMASAQTTTTQTAVMGASDDSAYSEQIQGADGIVYNCLPGTQQVNGQAVRQCTPANAGGANLGGLSADAVAGAVVAGVFLIAAVTSDGDDDDFATTTTTSTN